MAAHRPDAVLTDIRMPPTFTTEGIDAAKRIRSEFPEIGVVVLSQYVEEDYAYDLLADGVAGLGLPAQGAGEPGRRPGRVPCTRSPAAARRSTPKVVEGLMARKSKEASSPLRGLTEREREVLQAMATGRSNAAIAATLFMSERAVEKHIGSVFQKLDVVNESDVNRRVMAVLAFLEATAARRRLRGASHPRMGGQPPVAAAIPARSWQEVCA